MSTEFSAQTIGACLLGMVVGASAMWLALPSPEPYLLHEHPIADPSDGEYHVHADFHIYLDDQKLDLAQAELMTTAEQELHDHVHLHDGNGEVVHIHAEGITFAEFLESIGITLSDTCVTRDDAQYCESTEEQLTLFVNGIARTEPFTTYIPADDDSILLYHGPRNAAAEYVQGLIDAVPDDACYYSGTCPERGVAPAESCGLTCEL